ncbi:MAG TPA: MFS transporter [Gaiella sp.]
MSSLTLALRGRTFRSLHRHRNYRLFFAGQVVSLAGSWMQNVALAWLVLELSGSPLAVGALVFCRFVPFTVLGLVAGVVADRLDTRRLVMASQAFAMVVSVVLAAVTITGTATLPLVYALAALGGIALVFDAPGRQALTFRMVGRCELSNAVSLNSGLFNASRVAGPAIAGVVIAAVGTGACFALNAVSFLAVLAALALLREEELVPVERDTDATLLRGTREALSFVWRTPELRAVLAVVTAVSALGFNFHVLVPLLASDAIRVGPEGFGLLSAAFGLGALAGALATASLRTPTWRTFLSGATGFSVLLLVLAPLHHVVLAAVALFAVGVCFTLFTASANALVQLGAPDHLRGRLIGLYLFAFAGLAPVGGLLAGWLADIGGTALAFSVAGLAGLVSVAVATAHRRRAGVPESRVSASPAGADALT